MSYDHRERWHQCPRCKQSYSDADGGCENCQVCVVCDEPVAHDDIRDFNGCECCRECYQTIQEELKNERDD